MKRWLAMLLCAGLALGLCACGETGGQSVATTAKTALNTREAVEQQVSAGQMSGTDVKLGDTPQTVLNIYPTMPSAPEDGATASESRVVPEDGATRQTAAHADEDELFLEITEGQQLTRMQYEAYQFFYINDQAEQGVGVIINSKDAYHFTANTTFVEDVTYALGAPDVQDQPGMDQLFFMLGTPTNLQRLTYLFGTKRLDFIFDDGLLAMTVLTDTEIYDGFYTATQSDTTAV